MNTLNPLQEAIANVVGREIVKDLPQPLREILKEGQRIHAQREKQAQEQANQNRVLQSHQATIQLLDQLNNQITSLKSDLKEEQTKASAYQRRANVLTYVSIALGIVSVGLAVWAVFY